jgi:hypothetical protein
MVLLYLSQASKFGTVAPTRRFTVALRRGQKQQSPGNAGLGDETSVWTD